MSSRSNSKNGSRNSSSPRFVAVTTSIRPEGVNARVGLTTTYLQALKNAGLVPLLLPPVYDTATALPALERVHGLLLTGGGDVDPAFYGDAPHHTLKSVSRARDESEIALVHAARQLNLPTLAICRGIQILNVALGGSLVQDISSDWPGSLPHDDSEPRSSRSHKVTLEPDSLVARAVQSESLEVNSLHHQAVDRLGEGLRITGRADDGVVEAIESTDAAWWALCVQWHPEDLVDDPQSPDRGIFSALASRTGS